MQYTPVGSHFSLLDPPAFLPSNLPLLIFEIPMQPFFAAHLVIAASRVSSVIRGLVHHSYDPPKKPGQ